MTENTNTFEYVTRNENEGINIATIRESDIIWLANGEGPYAIHKVAITDNGEYILSIVRDEKDISLVYNIVGDSLEDSSLNLTKVGFLNTDEDKLTFYVPKFGVELLPVLTINGEDKIIYKLTDLDGLKVEEPQILHASYKYTITAVLQKKMGRHFQVLKQEQIICGDLESCKKRLAELENSFTSEDMSTEELAKEIFKKNFSVEK